MKQLILILSLVSFACLAPALVPAITPTATTPQPTATNQVAAFVTAYESLHVRQHPGETELVIGYLYHDEPVTLTGSCRNGWAEIVWRGGVAWVNASYLSENKCSEEE